MDILAFISELKCGIWAGQKVPLGFSIAPYGKILMNFLANYTLVAEIF